MMLLGAAIFCTCLNMHFWWTYAIYPFPVTDNGQIASNHCSDDTTTTPGPTESHFPANENTSFPDKGSLPFLLGNIDSSLGRFLWNSDNTTSLPFNTVSIGCSKVEYFCIGDSRYHTFLSGVWHWINLSFYSLIPFVSISLMNLSLAATVLWAIYKRKRNLNLSQGGGTTAMGGSSILLVSAGILYLICTGPMAVFHFYEDSWLHNRYSQPLDLETEAYRRLWRAILENISYLTNALNFLVYCVSGSRFRKEFALMMKRQRDSPTRNPHKTGEQVPSPNSSQTICWQQINQCLIHVWHTPILLWSQKWQLFQKLHARKFLWTILQKQRALLFLVPVTLKTKSSAVRAGTMGAMPS